MLLLRPLGGGVSVDLVIDSVEVPHAVWSTELIARPERGPDDLPGSVPVGDLDPADVGLDDQVGGDRTQGPVLAQLLPRSCARVDGDNTSITSEASASYCTSAAFPHTTITSG